MSTGTDHLLAQCSLSFVSETGSRYWLSHKELFWRHGVSAVGVGWKRTPASFLRFLQQRQLGETGFDAFTPGDSDSQVEIGLNGNLQPELACLGRLTNYRYSPLYTSLKSESNCHARHFTLDRLRHLTCAQKSHPLLPRHRWHRISRTPLNSRRSSAEDWADGVLGFCPKRAGTTLWRGFRPCASGAQTANPHREAAPS